MESVVQSRLQSVQFGEALAPEQAVPAGKSEIPDPQVPHTTEPGSKLNRRSHNSSHRNKMCVQSIRNRQIISQLYVMGGTCAQSLSGKVSLWGHRTRQRVLNQPSPPSL